MRPFNRKSAFGSCILSNPLSDYGFFAIGIASQAAECGRPIQTLSKPGEKWPPTSSALLNQDQFCVSNETSRSVTLAGCCNQGGCHTRKNRFRPFAELKAV